MDQEPNITTLHHTSNPVASYAELPTARFRDQEPNEQIFILLRRHFITNFSWIFISIVALLIPSLLRAVHFSDISGLDPLKNVPNTTVFLFETFWYIVIIGYALQSLLSWYFNVYLITSLRVLDVDFIGLLEYSSTEAELRQIQDVSHKQVGLWQLLFNYGTVEIQTAGIRQDLVFGKIPKPNRVADILTDLLPGEGKESQIDISGAPPQTIDDEEIV